MKVTNEILTRYLNCESSPREERAILDWLEESEDNKRELAALDAAFTASLLAPKIRKNSWRKSFLNSSAKRWAFSSAVIAVIFVMSFFGGQIYSNIRTEKLSSRMTSLVVPVGQRVDVTLADGTVISLNSGSRLEYPIAFGKDERRVRLEGEAMFSVAKDPDKPFIVEADPCTVEALGTRFNVVTGKDPSEFCASLLEGKVRVTKVNDGHQLTLNPGEMASICGDSLCQDKIPSATDFLWTEGIISLTGKSFENLMKNYEKAYGFNVIYMCNTIPQIRCSGKIRIADGIEHAMSILKMGGTDFNYKINYNLNEVYVW